MTHLGDGRNLGAEGNRLCLESRVARLTAVGQHYLLAAQVALAPVAGAAGFKVSVCDLHRRADFSGGLIGEQQRRREFDLVSFEIFGDQVKLKILAADARPEQRLQQTTWPVW